MPSATQSIIFGLSAITALAGLASCVVPDHEIQTEPVEFMNSNVTPSAWPKLSPPPLDPAREQEIDRLLARMTLEQKVGQVIQADTNSVTPDEVREYRLGSVLSGGNSAPGDEPYASADVWMAAADAYFEASLDPEGVDIAIPLIWGIDAVHGHANLIGATVFPHNIGLGAANDPDLIEEIMEVTAAELLLSGHDWTFAPTLAVPRDDRWGRTYEGFSEDPALVASYADRIVYGLQGRPGTDEYYADGRVISSAKHFLGDGGTTNGIDQGDTVISESELRDIHAAGYMPAIDAGVGTIMASFNSWNGRKMHGHEGMLTDVLKTQMGFQGFVVGDWNGHGQLPGCTNANCPDALIAGVDMYMAPDSWKGIYHSLLAAVESGEVPMARLDDAVRRILRVKLDAGVFDKPRPSARIGANQFERLGSSAHKAVARRAVRQSLVLLKNNGNVLPIDPSLTVLVVGDGANSISKQAGGWTLSWQGGGYANADFPFGETILNGIEAAVSAGGGTVIFDPTGDADVHADIVIAVYGEDPYAEFQGDRTHLAYEPVGFDTAKLADYREAGLPVVSVFLSGRPLWVNPEINRSDAFVAAWLPGTEGGGIGDLLFQTDASYDFTGRLSFSWPATALDFDNNLGADTYAPLFPFGFGLSYEDRDSNLPQLSEDSGLSASQLVDNSAVFRRGGTLSPWRTFLVSSEESVLFSGTGANLEGLQATRVDHLAQEDGIALSFTGSEIRHGLAFIPEGRAVDWSADVAEDRALAFAFRSDQDVSLTVEMSCYDSPECTAQQTVDLPAGDWRDVRLSLRCFAETVEMGRIDGPLIFSSEAAATVGLADIRLVTTANTDDSCAS